MQAGCPWPTPNTSQYNMGGSSCMAPQANMNNFMGIPQGLSHVNSASAPMTHASQTTSCQAIDPFHDPDRRSTSIAALRLKAREHSVAMGILSAYGK